MSLTVVRYGSSSCFEQLRQIRAGDYRGLFLQLLLRELHTPRRIRLEIPVFDRVAENSADGLRGLAVIELEHAAEPLTAPDWARSE